MGTAIHPAWSIMASVLLMTVASGCIDDSPSENHVNWQLVFSHKEGEIGSETRANAVPIDREDAEEQVPFLIEALEEALHQNIVVTDDREQAMATESYLENLSGGRGYALILKFEGEFFSVDKESH